MVFSVFFWTEEYNVVSEKEKKNDTLFPWTNTFSDVVLLGRGPAG